VYDDTPILLAVLTQGLARSEILELADRMQDGRVFYSLFPFHHGANIDAGLALPGCVLVCCRVGDQ
jgi:hypothetical protein